MWEVFKRCLWTCRPVNYIKETGKWGGENESGRKLGLFILKSIYLLHTYLSSSLKFFIFNWTVNDKSLYLFTAALSAWFPYWGFKANTENERCLIKQEWEFSGR